MFCHLTLQGKPAPKREPEVSLTSSQSHLSSSLLLIKREVRGELGGYRFMIRNLGDAYSSVAAFICLLRMTFFFSQSCQGFERQSPALSGWGSRGVVLAGAG